MYDRRPDSMPRINTPELANAFIEEQLAALRAQIGDKKVLLALSGGVDSSVVAALLVKAVGRQLVCVHVNHGLLRKGEPEQVVKVFRDEMGAELVYVDAVDRFLDKLAGVSDPERKRHIIGEEFIDVFAEEARKLDGVSFLAQGTIWPDILESEAGIKAHHNAGGLPEDIASRFELVEPVKILFKDEVREVGRALGLPASMVDRQPFPGPGLGVRCPGAITRDRLEAVRESDAILREEFAKAGLEGKVWQYFTVVPDFKSTGVERQTLLRLALHHPRDQHGRRDGGHRRAPLPRPPRPPRLAHHDRGARHQPRPLRLHPEATGHRRIRVMLNAE